AARRAAERARDHALADLARIERERAADTTRAQLERALQECAALRQRLSAIGMLAAGADEPLSPPVPQPARCHPADQDRLLPPPHASQVPTPPYHNRVPPTAAAVYAPPPSPPNQSAGSTHPSAPSRSNTLSPPTTPPESGIRSTVVSSSFRATVLGDDFGGAGSRSTAGFRRQRSSSPGGEPPAKRLHSAAPRPAHRLIRLPSHDGDGDEFSQSACSAEVTHVSAAFKRDGGATPSRHADAAASCGLSAPQPQSPHSSPLPSIPSTPEPPESLARGQSASSPAARPQSPTAAGVSSPAAEPSPAVGLDFKPQVITTASATILLNAEGKRVCGEKMRAMEKRTRIGSMNPTVAKLSPLSDDELLELGSRPASRARHSNARGSAGRLSSSGRRASADVARMVSGVGSVSAPVGMSSVSAASANEGTARIATLQPDVDELIDDDDEGAEEEDGGEDELVDNDEFMAAVDAAESGTGGPLDAFSP
ncbi:hypothetical protein HDZ31DRAFT_51239, partial [Schizophyllum fasciatum]